MFQPVQIPSSRSSAAGRSSFLASIVLTSRTALILRLSKNWPKHITNMTTIPRCAPQFYLATERTFQEGSTFKDSSRSQGMLYILTGDHWSAEEAYRMGEVQKVAPDAKEALEAGIRIANKIADCGPLGIKTSLASAHLRSNLPGPHHLTKCP
jgi:hypothetical protein